MTVPVECALAHMGTSVSPGSGEGFWEQVKWELNLPNRSTAHKRLQEGVLSSQEYVGTRRSTFLISPSPTESGLAQTGPEAGILRHLLVAPVAEPPPLS